MAKTRPSAPGPSSSLIPEGLEIEKVKEVEKEALNPSGPRRGTEAVRNAEDEQLASLLHSLRTLLEFGLSVAECPFKLKAEVSAKDP
jgi:hypothetical protein